MQVHPDAKFLGENPVELSLNNNIYTGMMALYEYKETFFGYSRELQSRMYLFVYIQDKWMIEFRFTYPKGTNPESEIKKFMQRF